MVLWLLLFYYHYNPKLAGHGGKNRCNNLILLQIYAILPNIYPLKKHAGYSLAGAGVDYAE
jgi:hypothetical protein